MRITIQVSDRLLARAKQLMAKRKVTLRALVEDGLRKVLDQAQRAEPFKLRDASFKGDAGFVAGAGPEDIERVLRQFDEGRCACSPELPEPPDSRTRS